MAGVLLYTYYPPLTKVIEKAEGVWNGGYYVHFPDWLYMTDGCDYFGPAMQMGCHLLCSLIDTDKLEKCLAGSGVYSLESVMLPCPVDCKAEGL